LSRTPDDLDQEEKANVDPNAAPEEAVKKLPFFKRIFRRVNVYLLVFILLLVIAGAITVVNYLNSQKAPVQPDVASQTLSQEALNQLTNTDVNAGAASQTLTIQGNAIIAGQTLARGNVNIAGNLQTGGSIQAPSLTVSGTSNLGTTQVNTLQVANNVAIQGSTTVRDLNVAGVSSFSGAVTASQITVTHLILSGNATLLVPNHISFTGSSPSRVANNAVLGNGGSTSLSGSDTAGSVTINTGTNTVAGCFVKITFNQVFTSQPRVIISPVGIGAAQTQYYVNHTPTDFSICTANAAPTNQTFSFDYLVTY
jgi:hypothetical protein